ncbi:unnamed protein product [Dovyalis caffra]|uniref:Uncharacterized protein n=1 Tax=Dovyalis caffra TaxID=77055 RepID=A0AAV1RRJ0_9ROSI|nr:unnamed protein product [Dovyalis caffra]
MIVWVFPTFVILGLMSSFESLCRFSSYSNGLLRDLEVVIARKDDTVLPRRATYWMVSWVGWDPHSQAALALLLTRLQSYGDAIQCKENVCLCDTYPHFILFKYIKSLLNRDWDCLVLRSPKKGTFVQTSLLKKKAIRNQDVPLHVWYCPPGDLSLLFLADSSGVAHLLA